MCRPAGCTLWATAAAVVLLAISVAVGPDALLRRPQLVHEDGVVVITGATSGIGKHAAFNLAERGFVVFAGARSKAKAEILRKQTADSGNLKAFEIDVTNYKSITEAKKRVHEYMKQEGKPLVGVVNNAGISSEGATLEDMKKVFDVNIYGVFRVTETFLSLLIESKGRVVNIGSLAGIWGTGDLTYVSSKFALEGFSDTMRNGFRSSNVSVSLVQPGYVKSGMCSDSERCHASPVVTSEKIYEALTSKYPKERYPVHDDTSCQ